MMGYADLDPPPNEQRTPPRDAFAWSEGIIGLVVRLAGIALLVLGAALALKVVVEAVGLYQQPSRIERFARAVEQGSHIDRVLSPDTDHVATDSGGATAQAATAAPTVLRLSYFAAWFIVLMLLLVVSGIAVSLVSAGGRLALGAGQPRRRAD